MTASISAAGLVARGDARAAHDAGLPIRIAVAIVDGLRHRRAVDDRRGAGRLEAPHRAGVCVAAPSAAYST